MSSSRHRSRSGRLYDMFLRKIPQQSRSRSVVEAILTAAIERVSRASDDDDVVLDQIAHRAGVGIGSLYDYFRDRQSVLAGLAAKLTEDNLREFEEVLAATRTLPLRAAIERVADHTLDTYTKNKRFSRLILRVAHSIGLMPALAASQTEFARMMAATLKERDDVDKSGDIDALSWVLTQAAMGVIHTLVWQDEPPFSREQVRAQLTETAVHALMKRS